MFKKPIPLESTVYWTTVETVDSEEDVQYDFTIKIHSGIVKSSDKHKSLVTSEVDGEDVFLNNNSVYTKKYRLKEEMGLPLDSEDQLDLLRNNPLCYDY